MKSLTRKAASLLAVTALALTAVATPAPPSHSIAPIATGFAKPNSASGNDSRIYFAAYENADGTVAGGGVLINYTLDVRIYFDFTSTLVNGEDTYLAGPVTHVVGAGPPVGATALIAVQDNGVGYPSPDLVSNLFVLPPVPFETAQDVLDIAGPIPESQFFTLAWGDMKEY